jgi:hypothetical protein
MYLPKAATPHVLALQNAARRAPSNVASQSPANHKGQQNQALDHIFARKQAKSGPAEHPWSFVVTGRETSSALARSRLTSNIQYSPVSTKLWGSKRLRKMSRAGAGSESSPLSRKREAILHGVRAQVLLSSSPRGKLRRRIEMRGSRTRQNIQRRCVKWRPLTAASREPGEAFDRAEKQPRVEQHQESERWSRAIRMGPLGMSGLIGWGF